MDSNSFSLKSTLLMWNPWAVHCWRLGLHTVSVPLLDHHEHILSACQNCTPKTGHQDGWHWLKWPFNVFMYYTENQMGTSAKLLPSPLLLPSPSQLQHSQSPFHRFSSQNFFILNHCQIKITPRVGYIWVQQASGLSLFLLLREWYSALPA